MVACFKTWLCAAALLGVLMVSRAQHGAEAAKASLAALEIPEGLKVELFASDPLLFNPVAFAIDEQGRFFIAESHRWKDSIFDLWTKDDRWKLADFSFTNVAQREAFLREEFATNLTLLTKDPEILRLVEDKDGDGVAETSSVFADGFNKITSGPAAGVFASDGQVWFASIPDLWRFEYDSQANQTAGEILHTGYGVRTSVSGHDLHGLIRGFDGRLYFSVGDRGANVRGREGQQIESFNAGAVFRCEPDGSNLELFATGLRNPQDLAFDVFGNLWTHDNDTSGDDPPRVLHLVEGGEYGWLQAYQFMPNFGPWVRERVWEGKLDGVLPPAGFGAQGPSGLVTYPGVGLPAKYNGALLACDFPQGTWAYFFDAKGASYQLRKERFVWALGPTDVDFGPDGAVYISDWGRSYAMPMGGRLLRVTPLEATHNARELRDLLGGKVKSSSIENLSSFLAHADMRVRAAAQFELERRKAFDRAARVALDGTNQFARIHAIWAIGNGARHGAFDATEALLTLATDQDPEIRAQAAQQLQHAKGAGAVNALVKLLEDESPRVKMFAALSLAHSPAANEQVGKALLRLAESADSHAEPFIRHAIVHALVRRNDVSAIEAAARGANPLVRNLAVHSFRRLRSPQLASLLIDPSLDVRRDAARAINDLAISEAFPVLGQRLDRYETDPQILLRAINADFRLGSAESWERVLRFATNAAHSEPLRVDALAALGDWVKPSPLDRVIGVWRPLEGGRKEGDRMRLLRGLQSILQEKATNVLVAAIDCVEKTSMLSLADELGHQVGDPSVPLEARVRALNALGNLKAGNLGGAMKASLYDSTPALRAEAVRWVGQVSPADAVPIIERIITSERDLRSRQNALGALGKLRGHPAQSFIGKLVRQLETRAIPLELQLDVIEAAEAIDAPGLSDRLRPFISASEDTNSLAGFGWALQGGDAALGKTIFLERDALGCVRCHAVKGQGGIVGPDLTGIASKRDRRHLLESIVHPNAHLTTGYESVSLALTDGGSLAGTVKAESEADLTLDAGEDGQVTIAKSRIQARTRTLSAMPEGLAQQMTRRELRDLLEYLASLK